MNSRAIAATLLAQVLKGRPLSETLNSFFNTSSIPKNDQAFIKELCYGSTRWYFRLNAIAQKFLHKALASKDDDIQALIIIGLYQLLYMRVPVHAAVSETVDATRELKKSWAKKLLNAILRNFLRKQEMILKEIDQNHHAAYSHPQWLLDALTQAWPNEWQTILDANNLHPPLCLRVNLQKISRENYLKKLKENGIDAIAVPLSPYGIILAKPQDVTTLPGFLEGESSVQDTAAQLTASLIDLKPSLKMLDACAAPGGKTTHLLEVEPQLKHLLALDNDPKRIEKIQENLSRLNMTCTCVCADAMSPTTWWDQQPFDRILLDVPCSSTGVIRRHPDIKILRRASDIPLLTKQQLQLLEALWPLLKPGGLLLYVTCSILPDENENILTQFLKLHPDAKEKNIDADWGIAKSIGRQILPSDYTDGFYYAKLEKI